MRSLSTLKSTSVSIRRLRGPGELEPAQWEETLHRLPVGGWAYEVADGLSVEFMGIGWTVPESAANASC